MKYILLVILTVSLLFTFYNIQASETQQLTQEFSPMKLYQQYQFWNRQYNKTSLNNEYRFQVFSENYMAIINHNQYSNSSVSLQLNQFADLTLEEFAQTYMGRRKTNSTKHLNYTILPASNADKIDWTALGKVQAVKNQGQCGSCWAFSAVAGLEGIYAIKSGNLVSLSEQQVVSCSKNGGNEGCNGGDLPPAFDYVVANGIESEASYPYSGTDSRCAYDKSKVVFTPTGYTAVKPNSPSQLESAVTQQPVPICIEADSFAFQFYKSGVLDSASCGTVLDHCVLVSGFDSTAAKPYWMVKNSWGKSWGNQGYVWISKGMTEGSKGICGMYEEPVYPTWNK